MPGLQLRRQFLLQGCAPGALKNKIVKQCANVILRKIVSQKFFGLSYQNGTYEKDGDSEINVDPFRELFIWSVLTNRYEAELSMLNIMYPMIFLSLAL